MLIREKILEVLFNFPLKSFSLRELSRNSGVSIRSVILHIEKLKNENLIDLEKRPNINLVTSRKNEKFREEKENFNLNKLKKSGLIQELNALSPETIILFGSYARGEDTENSDIDIALIGNMSNKNINVKPFENQLRRKISLHNITNIKNEENEFKNTLANGKILKGYLNLFE